MTRSQAGLLSDVKSLGDSVFEMREFFGPDWRTHCPVKNFAALSTMTKETKISELPNFDAAEHLKNESAVAAYLTLVLEDCDAVEFAHALGVAARARDMT
jgi:hypothetical protein